MGDVHRLMRLRRARAQHLTDDAAIRGTVPEVVAALGGIQAQAMPAATLAVRPRSRGLIAGDVSRARNEERSIVRTWAMRGTLHLLAAADAGWMVALLGPIFAAKGRRRRRQLGIDDALAERAVGEIRRLLEAGPLPRDGVIEGLAARGIAFEPRSQAPIHLIALAAMQGVLCYGPDRDGDETFVLVTDWIGERRPIAPATAARRLAERYLAAHGPAGALDFAAWSGLPMAMAREACAAVPPPHPPPSRESQARPSVRLLPAFDEYLLGYAGREFALTPALERRLQRGGGWIHPGVIADGRGIGAWRTQRRGGRLEVLVEPFERITQAIATGIQAEVSDLGRYLAIETRLADSRNGRRPAARRRPARRR